VKRIAAPNRRKTAMDKLKLSTLSDDKPVKLTLELPTQVHRDLIAYAEVLGRDTSQTIEPTKLVAPMLAKFMATDRAFTKVRRDAKGFKIPRVTAPTEQH
jgi:hypothetical protein